MKRELRNKMNAYLCKCRDNQILHPLRFDHMSIAFDIRRLPAHPSKSRTVVKVLFLCLQEECGDEEALEADEMERMDRQSST